MSDELDNLKRHSHPFVDISAGEYRASISTFGGGLRSLEYSGKPLVVSYPEGAYPPLSSGIILAPWPNRTADGVFAHDGVLHRLDITEPARATAIHGFVGQMAWHVADKAEDFVALELSTGLRQGWPWPLRMRVTWSLDAKEGLRASFDVRNEADASCPFGLGWHPYLSALGAPLDDCVLHLPVGTNLPLDSVRNLPAGPEFPARRVLPDVEVGQRMAGVWLDHCFGEISAQEETLAEARLLNPDGEGVRLWVGEGFNWFQVFTADPARREGYPGVGRALAVEPMTCPPDALRSGRDLIRLNAGEERSFECGISLASSEGVTT
ncbi:aldose 1-epimerase family protein [Corynebacterium jeikeium]|jgi:aldose 1-epimerase|uniref:aldose 1-epimerase family protein n=1 Tax=Corynebacterium jeikeium TaxID=38289 RepID=UPI0001B71607|nr:aldose 1-epimerase family protein [Corynebacterium jeikeium]EEW16709.1 aldose 1-epimerase [Corynebacterium jeikeium ATCC 43734]OOD33440.1 aldose epimerase [Corynebacterium jeikeium]WCZ52853.1 Aldose 1-epimerase [Corynebacterium jeikeium]SUY81841.1 aldose-1-epimerase [Corynebacterium jeikeium]